MTIKLKDMSLTRTEKDEMKETAIAPEVPRFPWGLSVRLEEESIEKLGLEDLPAPGKSMNMVAVVRVESASVHVSDSGKKRNLTLQITDLGLGSVATSEPESSEPKTIGNGPPEVSTAKVLFGD